MTEPKQVHKILKGRRRTWLKHVFMYHFPAFHFFQTGLQPPSPGLPPGVLIITYILLSTDRSA
ncbi:hypothetical protein I7I53_07707 [Histoplasma capsulatum var. duboisii H88]|uniref:Uncharacterized protein n=1 Tax=Ajellomyces capsulatus (strain H88) TaxID=544711 RepID=A0A8A1LF51_AJEC8|nr:hypothetical protein I7I53_07707 [Histoplasma capsulatum var. duboisii H88]